MRFTVAPPDGTGSRRLVRCLGHGIGDTAITTHLTASSISVGTLTIAANSTVTISPIHGGSLSDSFSAMPVPEPSAWLLLLIAAAAVWLKRR